jgi:hypothetical protein
MNELMHVRVEKVAPWGGLNSRKFFSDEKGRQLRGSIREHGVQETLLVARAGECGDAEMGRRGDGEGGCEFLIIAGERRWRETGLLMEELMEEHRVLQESGDEAGCAAVLALMEDRAMLPIAVIPAEKVGAALELNLVENLMREGITPLEEAEGFARMEGVVNPETGRVYTLKEIAKKVVGDRPEDVKYVQRRLKLRLAPMELLEAVNRGEVGVVVAEMVGRIPDAQAREEATREILHPDIQQVPLVQSQVRELIATKYMKALRKAGFPLEDEGLVPEVLDEAGVRLYGGSCETCPARTGNNPDLQEELSQGNAGQGRGVTSGRHADVCTHPACVVLRRRAGGSALMEMRRRIFSAGPGRRCVGMRSMGCWRRCRRSVMCGTWRRMRRRWGVPGVS